MRRNLPWTALAFALLAAGGLAACEGCHAPPATTGAGSTATGVVARPTLRLYVTSTIAGAVTGAILLVPLMLLFGTPGIAAGLALSEIVVLAVQLVKLRPFLWQRDTLTA